MINFKQKYNCLKKENKKIKNNFFKIINYLKLFRRKKKIESRKTNLSKKIIIKFIPFLDNINNFKNHFNRNSNYYIINFLKYMLKINDIRIINPSKNEDYNPHLHQAIIKTNGDKNKVIGVLKKGYILNNLVLRPALVCV